MRLNVFLKDELKKLESRGLMREMKSVDLFQGPKIVLEGRRVLNFCSNNYLGLAGDSRLSQAAFDCLEKEGYGSGASRLISGNMKAHRELEKKIAKFQRAQAALVFSTGYMANVGIITSLFDRHDVIFADKLNHASLIDGMSLSRARVRRYAHLDMEHLRRMLKDAGGYRKRAIITDTVFSMDGDLAPLKEIVQLAKEYDCIVVADEAHAFGVMGKTGRGCCEHFGCAAEVDVQMGTFSKAAGAFGSYVCGSKDLIAYLVNTARSFIYTTGMPPSVAAASLKGLEIIEHNHNIREKLWDNTKYFLSQLKVLGLDTMRSVTPIIPVVLKDSKLAVKFSRKLLEEGVFVTAIRPPTVPVNTARLRFTLMATHTKQELDFALRKIEKVGRELDVIST